MPAAAVASRTPVIAGSCGTLLGASGETAVAMGMDRAGNCPCNTACPRRARAMSGPLALLVRWSGRKREPRRHPGRRLRPVEALDLGGLAELGDVFALRAP